MSHSIRKTFVAGLLVLGTSGAGSADVLAVASRITPATGTNTTFAPVLIKDNNATTQSFQTTKANELVVITYNAECSGINGSGWLSVRIVVDGNRIAHPIAGTNFAFCHSGVEAGAVRQSFLRVPTAGVHTVRVDAAAQGGSTSWTLDDLSIVVEN